MSTSTSSHCVFMMSVYPKLWEDFTLSKDHIVEIKFTALELLNDAADRSLIVDSPLIAIERLAELVDELGDVSGNLFDFSLL